MKIIEWKEFVGMCYDVGKLIKDSDEKFTGIISISRGGNILGTILSHYLDIPEMGVIAAKSYSDIDKSQTSLHLGSLSYCKRLGDNVLIVDEVIDSGVTIKQVIESLTLEKFKVACLHIKTSDFKPDYYYENTNEWIKYPYEISLDKGEKNDFNM